MVWPGWRLVCHHERHRFEDQVLPHVSNSPSRSCCSDPGPHLCSSCRWSMLGIEGAFDKVVLCPLWSVIWGSAFPPSLRRPETLTPNELEAGSAPQWLQARLHPLWPVLTLSSCRWLFPPSPGESFRPKSLGPQDRQALPEQSFLSCEPASRSPWWVCSGEYCFYLFPSYKACSPG